MNREDQISGVRTRRALNNLQYSPNGKDIVGLSPRKTNQIQTKKGLIESKNKSNVKHGLKKRTSISLPDICATGNQQGSKSATSTPNKNHRTTSTSATPTKIARKEISVILEEKENPNILFNLNSNQKLNLNELKPIDSLNLKEKQKSKVKENLAKVCQEVSIQCNKSDEDMLLSDTVEHTPYWKLLAHKRFKSLLETQDENQELNSEIADLDKINEDLREKNNELLNAIKEYDEIKKMILETIDECDDEDGEDNDSGFEKSHIY